MFTGFCWLRFSARKHEGRGAAFTDQGDCPSSLDNTTAETLMDGLGCMSAHLSVGNDHGGHDHGANDSQQNVQTNAVGNGL